MSVPPASRVRPARAARDVGDWYDHPAWYDVLHEAGTAEEVRGLVRIAAIGGGHAAPARGARRRPRWLEPACGSGRYLRAAARLGVDAVGLDLNRAMIDYARARSRAPAARGSRRSRGRIELIRADMTRFALAAPVDFAFCTINTIRHLGSDGAVLAHLACVARALTPGGVYAVGLETTRYGAEFPSEDVWEGRRGRLAVRQVISYRPAGRRDRREMVHSHLVVTTPSRTRHLDSTYALRSYSRRQWTGLVARSAMEVVCERDPSGGEVLRASDGGAVGGYSIWVLRAAAGRGGASGR